MPTTTANLPDHIQPATAGDVLQEYADNRGVALRVDRAVGIIPGVKLLGTVSKKGREYPRAVMAKALPLYEGMRVNVDHVDPGQRRSLRDRIGLIKNVTLKEDGLYGDFHFNPKHALAEQIAWDAENAPQNLGFSHDTRGGSRNVGGKVVVESIDKVLSVDLVANPATTTGLFEDDTQLSTQYSVLSSQDLPPLHEINAAAIDEIHGHMNETDGKKTTPAQKRTRVLKSLADWQDNINALSSPVTPTQSTGCPAGYPGYPADDAETKESTDMDWKDIDLDGLKQNRPELLTTLQESLEKSDELNALQEELNTLRAERAARELQEAIAGELKTAGLDPTNKTQCSQVFLEDLSATADPVTRKAKIDDRKALVVATRTIVTPTTGSPLQETHDGLPIPPATAPLAQRIARFGK